MDDRESPFVRTQASRSLIRPQAGVRKFLTSSPADRAAHQLINRQFASESETTSPTGVSKRLSAPHTPLESLKQWELVEDGKGLQVVEKRAGGVPSPVKSKEAIPATSPLYGRTPMSGRRFFGEMNMNTSLNEKLRAFTESKIVQPIGLPLAQQPALPIASPEPVKAPLSLDLILKQQRTMAGATSVESTDMLQRLEQQVKAIEMDTIAARTTRQLENSLDFGPEVQLRYREHEDLLRNVTDDEAEG